MWATFILWLLIIFVFPAGTNGFIGKLIVATEATPYGVTGGIFLIFSGPVILLAILAAVYLMISGEDDHQIQGSKKRPSYRLWTFPVFVDGPFGVVSATELIGIMSRCCIHRTSPIEHATKYHVWLGHLTMAIFTLHGIAYVAAWAMQGHLIKELLEWKDIGVANLAGVISLIAGLLMWFTSFGLVRKQYFELFFYTHQLYIIFIVFRVLHVGISYLVSALEESSFSCLTDFLRFWQSTRKLLILYQPPPIHVVPWSWLSRSLQVTRVHISSISEDEPVKQQAPSTLTVSVEGPYGHETPYHLMYENLILVAGGIGVSPFLAILSDILHRAKEGNPCLPKNVVLVWAIKTSDELPLLSAVDIESEGRVHTPSSTCIFPVSRGHAISGLVGTGDNVWSGLYIISSIVGFIVLLGLLDVYYINPFHVTTWWYKGLLFIAVHDCKHHSLRRSCSCSME
ncbi:unnamed protein product [Rhodiola kirilowii]